ncbi:MAG: porin, partial [Proteobacteria bacterium]|nr:porin [Pseudomonadota bacterium]
MRKILLASTALAGIALFSSPALAGMEVTVGGYNDFRAGFFDNRLTPGTKRHEDFQDEFQLEIEAKAKASNGMEYGVVASLWNGPNYATSPGVGAADQTFVRQENGIQVHQAYGYVNGAWGQIRLGDEHGASDFGITPPQTYDFGAQVNGAYTEFVDAATVFSLRPAYVDDVENNTKVSYFTPKFGVQGHKFQLGASYMPNWYDQGDNVILSQPTGVAQDPNGTDNYKNVFEIGGGYEGTWFDKFSTKAGFVVTTGQGLKTATFTNSGAIRDFTTWNVGGQVGYAGFTVGGNYVDGGHYNAGAGQNRDQQVCSVGG